MRTPTLYLLAIVTTMLGCSSKTDTVVTPPVSSVNTTPSVDDLEVNVSEGTEITLTPENTKIEFVGTHVGPDPDPNARTGHFAELAGTALIADDDIQSIQIEIQTASVSTPIEKLTNHLQAPDFFDVRAYPTAKFESTLIQRNDDGDHIITGNLTLLSETREIKAPARVGYLNGELSLSTKFKIDRTDFGMTQNQDKVNKEVQLTITVGNNASSSAASPDSQARQGRSGRDGRSGFDPEAMFAERDADSDGKLSGDEIHERMRDRLADIDTDGDGAVSLEELKARFANRNRGGGGRGGRGGEGGGRRGEGGRRNQSDQGSSDRPQRPE